MISGPLDERVRERIVAETRGNPLLRESSPLLLLAAGGTRSDDLCHRLRGQAARHGRVEHALLAVASGAGLALLPESAAEHYAAPGVRFVPIESLESAFESVVLTRPDTDDLATTGFLRALTRAARPRVTARRAARGITFACA